MWSFIGFLAAGMVLCISSASAQPKAADDKFRRELAQMMRQGSPSACFAEVEVISRSKEQPEILEPPQKQLNIGTPRHAPPLIVYDVKFLKVWRTPKSKAKCNLKEFEWIDKIPVAFLFGDVPDMTMPARMEVFIEFTFPFAVFSKLK
jgi:hypothetical protein